MKLNHVVYEFLNLKTNWRLSIFCQYIKMYNQIIWSIEIVKYEIWFSHKLQHHRQAE